MLPDNFSVCEKRLENVRKRLKTSGIFEDYDQILKDYEKDGIIERVSDDNVVKENGMPHRAVVKEDRETTKIRIVFDASCKINEPSLNECLYSGPNMLGKIFDILLRFSLHKIAFTADIKQAFLNVGIHAEHQDFLRFLWYDSNNDIVIYRFLRAVFGVTSSPFLLNATIRQHLDKFKTGLEEFVEKFLTSLYVDDEASGCESVSGAKEFYLKAVEIMSKAGLELRKWRSNNKELQAFFDERTTNTKCYHNDKTFSDSQLGQKTLSSKKDLGMKLGLVL